MGISLTHPPRVPDPEEFMLKPSTLFILPLLGLALAACGQNTVTPVASAEPVTKAQRLLPQPCDSAALSRSSVPVDGCGDPVPPDPIDPGGSGVILAPGAHILSNEALSYDPDSGMLTVQQTQATASYAIGDVVIGGRTTATTAGVPPRRIVGITPGNNTLIFTTQDAGLTDVIEEGSLDFTRTLTVADINSIDQDPDETAASLNTQKLMRALSVDCSSGGHKVYGKSFTKTFDGSSTLSGCFQIDFDTTLKLKISHFKLDTFEASGKLSEQAKLQLQLASSSASLNHEWNLGTVWFNPIDIQMGPVPLLITPYIKFSAGLDGSVTGTMSYTATQQASYKAGLQYANGKLSGINERNSSIDIPDPTLGNTTSLQMSGKAYVEARPGITFFTTIVAAHADGGVYAGIRAYAKVNVDTQKHPLWQITAGPQFCYGYNAHLEILLGLIDKTWSGDQCGNEIRILEKHSNDVGPVLPSSSNSWNSVILNFNVTQGEIELHKILPSGGDVVIAYLTSSGPFDLTPYIDPFDDTEFKVVGISKRSSGIFGSYGHQLDLNVLADNASIWPAGHRGCTGCHSQQEYHFTVNKNLALLQPLP
jgi:hypothetical protein